nr:RNA demethylase ALKBH10B-like isoform X2 [Ipomoea batatas]
MSWAEGGVCGVKCYNRRLVSSSEAAGGAGGVRRGDRLHTAEEVWNPGSSGGDLMGASRLGGPEEPGENEGGLRDGNGRESEGHNSIAEASSKDLISNGSDKLDGAEREVESKTTCQERNFTLLALALKHVHWAYLMHFKLFSFLMISAGTEFPERPESNSLTKNLGSSQTGDLQSEADKADRYSTNSDGSCGVENECNSTQVPHGKPNLTITPKTFVGKELCDGKMVNVVDGLKLYEEIVSDSEVSELVTLVNDLRVAGKRGQLQGQTFIVSKRPMKGHGREMIQLGVPVTDVPGNEAAAGISKGMTMIMEGTCICPNTNSYRKIEPIPVLLQDLIESLMSKQVFPVKPDSCMIDIFNEGDHSQPNMWPHWFGRPICVLFLTECDITYGKIIDSDHRGDYRGSLRLSLAPGSLLVMQGRSADFAKHAIPSLRKQRILVTLTKSHLEKMTSGDGLSAPSSIGTPSPHWVPRPSKSPNHIHHRPAGPRHYSPVPVPTTGVLPVPAPAAACPQLAPNGIQPIFVSTPVAPPMPFPAAVALPPASVGWAAAPPPRHPPPRLPVPGTGVFLPPGGSGNSPNQSAVSTSASDGLSVDTSPSEKENGPGTGTPNGDISSSPKGKVDDGDVQKLEMNGNMESSGAGKSDGGNED